MAPGMMQIPTAYTEGYPKARVHDPALADLYMEHTGIGDPELDPVMEELASLSPAELHRFVAGGIERNLDVLRAAPQPLREFFDNLEEPSWLDHDRFRLGNRAFHKNADLMLVAFVAGVLVEGFSTLIAKSFNMTGRVALTNRRLQQNNRQLLDIFMPGGLRRDGDGWKLSTRVRFVHARIRVLLAKSEDWRREAWGVPVSAAHLGLAISVFSKRLLDYSSLLGADFGEEERASVLDVWRYAGYVMGIPESILYTDGASAQSVYTVGFECEPPPDTDSATMANALIQAIPGVAAITDPNEQEKVLDLAYRLSRALIGKRLADSFEYPRKSTVGTLFLFRARHRIQRFLKREHAVRSGNFTQLLQISAYDEAGLSYRLPDHVRASKSSPW